MQASQNADHRGLAQYREALSHHLRAPHLFRHPRLRHSPRSLAKRARKARMRALHVEMVKGRSVALKWYLAHARRLADVAQVREEMKRVIEIERLQARGAALHPLLLAPVRRYGSFAAWRNRLLDNARGLITAARQFRALSTGVLP